VALQLLFVPGRFFSFVILYTFGRTSWTGNQPVTRPLPTHRTTQTQNTRTQISMPQVGFELTILVLERAKTDKDVSKVTKSKNQMPITVAARSKAWTGFAHSNTGFVGSNPTWGMDVCVRLFCVCVVLCVGIGLTTGWSPVQGVLWTLYRIKKLKNLPRSKGLYSHREREN
jgi:hypothetical protein